MPKTILIVDDNRDIVGLIEVHIELSDRNYGVEKAYDGEEGLEKIRRLRPDLVLLDIMMPKLDGYGVLEGMKGDEYKPPVIMMTAKDKDDLNFSSYPQVQAVFRKPMVADELMNKIDELIGDSEPIDL